MSQTNEKRPETKTSLLREVRKPGWVYICTADYGCIRLRKRDAKMIVRTSGDDLTFRRIGPDLLIERCK